MLRRKTTVVVLLLALGSLGACGADALPIPEPGGGDGVIQPQGLAVCLPPTYAQDPTINRLGTVEVAASVVGKLPVSDTGQSVWALFKYYPTPTTCSVEERQGDCSYVHCTPAPLRQAEMRESLGTLSITAPDGTSLDIVPRSDGSYDYDRQSEARTLFVAGERTTIRAAGRDGQPGFEMNLEGPSQPKELSLKGRSQVMRDSDLELSWKAPADAVGYAHFVLNAVRTDDTVVCDYPMARSSGTVPADLLKHLPDGWSQAMFFGVCAASAEAGAYRVSLSMREHSDVGMLAVEVR